MNEKVVKQCIGIDCAKDELAVCLGQLTHEWKISHKATEVFANDQRGFKKLTVWAEKLSDKEAAVSFVMEATGVYHEKLAHYLVDEGKRISIVLPNRARHFAQTMKVRTVNDKESSKMLASLGLEKQLEVWEKPDAVFTHLKRLTRERERVLKARTVSKNELHAEEHAAIEVKSTIKRLKGNIRLQTKQIEEIEQEITLIIQSHPALDEKIKNICTVPGIGMMTATTVIAECNGFNLIRNHKQLVSYAGYDVVEKQSGTSVRGKARISGKGNKHIRRALHFPAISNVKYDVHHKNLYTRLEAKHGIKMKAYTAVQRKLLVLIYTLWKRNQPYNASHHEENLNTLKMIEQPHWVALYELDQVCSPDYNNLKPKVENNIQFNT